MIIGKAPFFLILFFLLAGPFLVPRLVWLAQSRTTVGVMSYEGSGTAGDLLAYSHVYFEYGGASIEITAPPALGYKHGDPVAVRYSTVDPANARVDTWIGLWGDLTVYFGIPAVVLLICFLHPDVVPHGSRLRLMLKSPYIRLL